MDDTCQKCGRALTHDPSSQPRGLPPDSLKVEIHLHSPVPWGPQGGTFEWMGWMRVYCLACTRETLDIR